MSDEDAGPKETGETMSEGMHETPGEDQGEKTALLDKGILGGKTFEVGDEVVLRIVGMHDQEVEVAYAPAEEGEGEEPHGEMSGGDGAPGEDQMAAMMG